MAQVIADETLSPREQSRISGNSIVQIDGGATRGSNLFHSFSQFSIPTGSTASFNNAPAITNIIGRVTGNSASTIDGVIRANGNANLFLINPNGIVFGRNAALNIGGSFLASTANAIQFGSQGSFSATNPTAPPLLTVNPSALSFNQPQTQAIANQAVLRVLPNRFLSLIGGAITVEGGVVSAPQGRIELSAVRGSGVLTLFSGGNSSSVSAGTELADISLLNNAQITTSGNGGAGIQFRGRTIALSNRAIVSGSTIGQQPGSNIVIDAARLKVENRSQILSLVLGSGAGGNITVNAQRLSVQNLSLISVSSFGSGRGGALTVNASDIELVGPSIGNTDLSGLFSQSYAAGNAGTLTVNTERLIQRDGALISTTTLGPGRGGTLTVNASDFVQLVGVSPASPFASGIYASTSGAGAAGSLTVNTQHLILQAGGIVTTASLGSGTGGSLTINATESVQLEGASPGLSTLSVCLPTCQTFSIAPISGEGLRPSAVSSLTAGLGDAGNLAIHTQQLVLGNGTVISANALPSTQGRGGNIAVSADVISLGDRSLISSRSEGTQPAGAISLTVAQSLQGVNSEISTSSTQASGGAIALTANHIQFSGDSDITTSVFKGEGGGGNIDLQAQSIILLGDSDVLAFSRDGRGGNITLDAPVFFGFNNESAPAGIDPTTLDGNSRVDINASGRLASGSISLPDLTTLQTTIVQLPDSVIDTNALIANSCIARSRRQGSFVTTGAGGLPPSPDELADSAFPTYEIVRDPKSPEFSQPANSATISHVIEIDGIYSLPNGELLLGRSCR